MTTALERPTAAEQVTFLELEITARCQLTCPSHCYAQAGPTRGHGSMTADDWKQVITQAAAYGIETVQFIGGEPTLHPQFVDLVQHALGVGLGVQVYSNLYQVRADWWPLFEHPRVTLATSYYSDFAAEHDQVTGRTGSHAKTRANIAEALRRGIHVQVGIVDIIDGQRIEQARADLERLGVTDIHTDRVRGVGNAADRLPSTSELCGNCARGRAAVMPDGQVTPCVLGRFLPAGSAKTDGLEAVLSGTKWAQVAASIPPRAMSACTPADSSDCDPSRTPACNPKY